MGYNPLETYGSVNKFYALVRDALTKKEECVCLGMSYGLEKDLHRRGMLS